MFGAQPGDIADTLTSSARRSYSSWSVVRMAHYQPVEQHPERRKVLLDGGLASSPASAST
jgi:hypothetical protein